MLVFLQSEKLRGLLLGIRCVWFFQMYRLLYTPALAPCRQQPPAVTLICILVVAGPRNMHTSSRLAWA